MFTGASGSGKTTLFHSIMGFQGIEDGAVLLDEPTAGLDEENRECVIKVLQELKRHAIVIVFTHDEKITQIANQVILI